MWFLKSASGGWVLVSVLIACGTFAVSARYAESAQQSVTLYGGPATRRYVSQILFHGQFDLDGAMLGLAYDRRLAYLGAGFALEVDLEAAHFFMKRSYSSMAAGLGIRYDTSRWIGKPSSFAVYTGPSYADDPVPDDGYRGRFLEYVAVEFALAFGNNSPWDGVIRMYHRSGTFGLYGSDPDSGSMLGIGLRRRF